MNLVNTFPENLPMLTGNNKLKTRILIKGYFNYFDEIKMMS
jgi:hypothetical protein